MAPMPMIVYARLGVQVRPRTKLKQSGPGWVQRHVGADQALGVGFAQHLVRPSDLRPVMLRPKASTERRTGQPYLRARVPTAKGRSQLGGQVQPSWRWLSVQAGCLSTTW
jgi:hypothetical protein